MMVARVPGMVKARVTIPSIPSVLPALLGVWLLLVDVADELADLVELVPGGFAEIEEDLVPGGFGEIEENSAPEGLGDIEEDSVPGGLGDIEEELKVELVVAPSLLDVCVGPKLRSFVTVDALGGQMVAKSVGAGASNVSVCDSGAVIRGAAVPKLVIRAIDDIELVRVGPVF